MPAFVKREALGGIFDVCVSGQIGQQDVMGMDNHNDETVGFFV
jgi:hypothetical protein